MKKTILISIIFIAIILVVGFPLQRVMTKIIFYSYLDSKNVNISNIEIIEIHKDQKTARGGYNIFVRFKPDNNLKYVYHYSIWSSKLSLDGIFKEGKSIGIDKEIVPSIEKDYYNLQERTVYKYKLLDMFKNRM